MTAGIGAHALPPLRQETAVEYDMSINYVVRGLSNGHDAHNSPPCPLPPSVKLIAQIRAQLLGTIVAPVE